MVYEMNIEKLKFVSFHPLLHLALAGNTKEILQRRRQSLISLFHVCFENIQVGRLVGKFKNDQHWVQMLTKYFHAANTYYSANTVKHRSNRETTKIFEKMQ